MSDEVTGRCSVRGNCGVMDTRKHIFRRHDAFSSPRRQASVCEGFRVYVAHCDFRGNPSTRINPRIRFGCFSLTFFDQHQHRVCGRFGRNHPPMASLIPPLVWLRHSLRPDKGREGRGSRPSCPTAAFPPHSAYLRNGKMFMVWSASTRSGGDCPKSVRPLPGLGNRPAHR